MPNWCNNSIAFYQEDDGNSLVEAFYADIQKYQNCKDPETGGCSNWVGHWLQSNQVNIDNIQTRGFFVNCELNADHVRVDMETAWSPLIEVYDLMAKKYNLSYVYIAEECGNGVYVNTDKNGRFFSDRYVLNCFDVSDLNLDADVEEEFGERLRELGSETTYYDFWEDVANDFKAFGICADDIESLNKSLERFNIGVCEYGFE